eukprot:PhM_4_TR13585/c0_g1_i1/m.13006
MSGGRPVMSWFKLGPLPPKRNLLSEVNTTILLSIVGHLPDADIIALHQSSRTTYQQIQPVHFSEYNTRMDAKYVLRFVGRCFISNVHRGVVAVMLQPPEVVRVVAAHGIMAMASWADPDVAGRAFCRIVLHKSYGSWIPLHKWFHRISVSLDTKSTPFYVCRAVSTTEYHVAAVGPVHPHPEKLNFVLRVTLCDARGDTRHHTISVCLVLHQWSSWDLVPIDHVLKSQLCGLEVAPSEQTELAGNGHNVCHVPQTRSG